MSCVFREQNLRDISQHQATALLVIQHNDTLENLQSS